MTKFQRILLYFLLFSTILIFGLIANFKVVSFPLLKAEFSASWEQQGLLVSMLQISYVSFCIIAGVFLGRFDIKPPFLSGFVFLSAGLVSMFFVPSFFLAAAAFLLIQAGFGFFEVGANALAARVFIKKPAMLLNILHAFYGVGAFIGPMAAGFITSNAGLNWRFAYFFSLPLSLILFLLAIFVKFPGNKKDMNSADAEKKKSFFDALKTPAVWFMAITLGLFVTMEHANPNWGSMYFQDIYGLDPRTTSAAFISAYFIFFTVSRLVCGILVEKIGYMRSLLGMVLIVFVIYIVIFLLGARGIYALPALGFFIGPIWPTLMAVAILYFGKDAPVMCSAIIAIGGTLNAGVQYLIGLTNKFLGSAWGYRSVLIYALLAVAILVFLSKKLAIKKEIQK